MVNRRAKKAIRWVAPCLIAIAMQATGTSGCLINPKDYPLANSASGGDSGQAGDDSSPRGGAGSGRGGTGISVGGDAGSSAGTVGAAGAAGISDDEGGAPGLAGTTGRAGATAAAASGAGGGVDGKAGSGPSNFGGGAGASANAGTSGATTCTAPYADELVRAITIALPPEFVWQTMSSCGQGGGCLKCTMCQASPCGSCALDWSDVNATPDGTQAYVDVSVSCANVAAKWTCGSDSPGKCSVTMQASGTVSFKVTPGSLQDGTVTWAQPMISPLLEWTATDTCGDGFSAADVGTDINDELGAALGSLMFSTSCG